QTFEAGQMMIFRPGDPVAVKSGPMGARLMLLGGATMNESRYIWWNFVSSSEERILEAKEAWKRGDWENGPFHLPPGDAEEFIPITKELDRTRPRKG
ncbi:MAG: pirin-like C-terminal cupin domain-containing protein, partial [Pseudomonadota bacterium]